MKYQTGESLKRANRLSSDFLLSFFLLSSVSVTVSQASMITAETITTIQTRKNDIKSLGIALTTYRYRSSCCDICELDPDRISFMNVFVKH